MGEAREWILIRPPPRFALRWDSLRMDRERKLAYSEEADSTLITRFRCDSRDSST